MGNSLYKLIHGVVHRLATVKLRITEGKRPSSYPYISGDTFRTFADHIHDEVITFTPECVALGDVVFVKADMIKNFFAELHPRILHPYVLVTHNSDKCIGDNDASMMDSKVIRWFAQNVVIKHPHIVPLPIGLENAHYHLHGVASTFDKIRKKVGRKIPRILLGFNIQTNPEERQLAHDVLSRLPVTDKIDGKLTPKEYLETLNQHSFVASPPGNGVDCHRTWETLYLGSIPIVRRSACMEYFQNLGLPIWIVDDWNELLTHTEDSLHQKYEELKASSNLEPLNFDYWRNLIYSYHAKVNVIQ